jgi:hypothetical protein
MKFKPLLALLAFTLAFSGLTMAQSKDTGAIVGQVLDEQGNFLPGVTVTVSSPNLMGSRAQITGANGTFRFPALPPGVYSITAELQNFAKTIRENIRLQTTATLTVDITLKSAIEEQVTVIAQSPTVDIKSTETASVTLGSTILRNMPYSQFTRDIVNMAPGVASNSAYGASGGTGISWQMDGVGVGDPQGGTAWVFLDHNIVEEAKVMGIALPAEYGNFTGAIFNMITKSGGNQFSGHAEVDFQNAATTENAEGDIVPKTGTFWSATNLEDYQTDFPDLTAPMTKQVDASAHLGGPIIRDKLWFYGGAQYYHNWDWVTGFPLAVDYVQPRVFLKLTSQLSSKTNMTFSGEYDDYDGKNRDASATAATDATTNQIDPNYILNFNLTHIASPSTFFDVKAAYFNGYYDLEPINGRDVSGHFFLNENPDMPGSGNMRHYNPWRWAEHDRYRFQVNASLTHYAEDFIKGNQDFKFGVEFERSKARDVYAYTGVNHMYYYDSWGPSAYEGYPYMGNYYRWQYEGYTSDARLGRMEAFAQDSWQITPRLNVNLGLRYTYVWGGFANGDSSVYSASRLAPRLGFTYDILGDKSTVIKAHYGQYTEGVYTYTFDRLAPDWSNKYLDYWDPVNNSWYRWRTILHGKWKIDDGIKHPYMEQFTAGIERELFKDASISITYINRNYKNIIGAVNNAATYEPFEYPVEELGQTYTLYELTSGSANDYLIKNIKQGDVGVTARPYRKYWGIEFLFNKRFSNRWQLLASYVYSQSKGTMDNLSSDDIGYGYPGNYFGADPNFWLNGEGNSTNDPTHMIKIQGTYLLPWGIYFNAYFRGITGDAYTTRIRTKKYAQGRITFFAEQRGKYHYPMPIMLDLRLEKTFTLAKQYQLGLILDVFNLFNDNSPYDWGTRVGYDYYPGQDYPSTDGHELYGVVDPRRVRIGVRFTF